MQPETKDLSIEKTYKSETHKPGPPPGYRSAKFPTAEFGTEMGRIARQMLHNEMWTMIPFDYKGRHYIAKIEPHSNAPKGVSVYEPISQAKENKDSYTPPLPKPSVGRTSILNRLTDILKDFSL